MGRYRVYLAALGNESVVVEAANDDEAVKLGEAMHEAGKIDWNRAVELDTGSYAEALQPGEKVDPPAERDLGAELIELLRAGLDQGTALHILGEQLEHNKAEGAAIAAAREQYANDDLEIDDIPCTSRGDDGCWVAAWVWVADTEEAEHGDT